MHQPNLPGLISSEYYSKLMTYTSKIIALIQTALNTSDPQKKEEATKELISLRTAEPKQLISAYIDILKCSHHPQVKTFAALQIKICLSPHSEAKISLKNFQPQFATMIKESIFETIKINQNLPLARTLGETFGQVLGNIEIYNSQVWPQIRENTEKLLIDSSKSNCLVAGFNIWKSFLNNIVFYFQDNSQTIAPILKIGLQHDNPQVSITALTVSSEMVGMLESQELTKKYKDLIPLSIEAVQRVFAKSKDERSIELLGSMIEMQSKLFKKNYEKLEKVIMDILKDDTVSKEAHRGATDVLVQLGEHSPILLRKRPESLKALVDIIISHMNRINHEVTEQWKSPPEGYVDDTANDEDYNTTRHGMSAIDRLINSVNANKMLPILSNAIESQLKSKDWRCQYTAIMVMSQIAEYITDVTQLAPILEQIVPFLQNQNPVIRYAVCHTLGQFADDSQPSFQTNYGEQIFYRLMEVFQYDPVPRVVSHAAAALTNLLQSMRYFQVVDHLPVFIMVTLHHIEKGISIVQENSMATLAATMEAAKKTIEPYLQDIMALLLSFHKLEKYQSPKYNQLKGQTIQTMTIIACEIGPQMFSSSIHNLIEIMAKLQASPPKQNGPLNNYIVSGWQRIFITYKKNIGSHFNQIMPGLLKLVGGIIDHQLSLVNKTIMMEETDKEKEEAKEEDIDLMLAMLSACLSDLQEMCSPYQDEIAKLLRKLIDNHISNDIKMKAVDCLSTLIQKSKDNHALVERWIRDLMNDLSSVGFINYQASLVEIQGENLVQILQENKWFSLTQNEAEEFGASLENLIRVCEAKQKECELEPQEEDDDSVERQDAENRMEKENVVKAILESLLLEINKFKSPLLSQSS